MSRSRHPKTTPGDRDLQRDPRIGPGKGGRADRDRSGGETTFFEGDVLNDPGPQGGVGPGHRVRLSE